MTVLKRIAPASAFKVGLVVHAFVGLLLGALCTTMAFAGLHFAHHGTMGIAGRAGMLAIIICPIIYGLVGGATAALGAAVYNLASGWVGGVEVDIA